MNLDHQESHKTEVYVGGLNHIVITQHLPEVDMELMMEDGFAQVFLTIKQAEQILKALPVLISQAYSKQLIETVSSETKQ